MNHSIALRVIPKPYRLLRRHPLPPVEDGIPIPDRYKWAAMLRRMKVGQSFLVDEACMRHAIITRAKRIGVAVVSRKVNGLGYRIWRVKKKD